jgi:hypothetical protein
MKQPTQKFPPSGKIGELLSLEVEKQFLTEIKYACYGVHKTNSILGCSPVNRPTKTKCPNRFTNSQELIKMLQVSIKKHAYSNKIQGRKYPENIWYYDSDRNEFFEAKLSNQDQAL